MMDNNDTWERDLLNNLTAAGEEGAHTAEYLRRHEIKIIVVDNQATNLWWRPLWTRRGMRIQNKIFLSRFLRDKPAHSAWLLASLVHEVRHLEQGFWTAFSVYGELDAWQAGFRFYRSLRGQRPLSPPIEKLLALPLSRDKKVLRQARALINLYENKGSSLGSQVMSVVTMKKSYLNIYWIKLMPLTPLFHRLP